MTNVSIRAPLSLVEELKGKGTNLTDIAVAHWMTLSSAKVDPHFVSVQSKIYEYIQIDPDLPRKYSHDDIATERIIMMRLALDGLDATASEISAAMVASGKVK